MEKGNIWHYLYIAIISMALLIVIIGFIYLIFDFTFNLSESNFSGIVSFLGSIIVGALTFIGVIITIKKNSEINHDNLEHQKKLQLESINKAAELNDKRERQLIVANIKFRKLDSIVQHMIENNSLNDERFNIIRNYIDCRKRIRSTRKTKYTSVTLDVKIGRKHLNDRLNALNDELNVLLDEETKLRIEIMSISAKIKSDSLYIEGLDTKLDSFRVFQADIIEEFSELIRREEYEFEENLKEKSEMHLDKVNESIRLCTDMINEEMKELETQCTL